MITTEPGRRMRVGYTIVFFVATLGLGGGTRNGFLADVVLQIASVPLLLWSIWRIDGDDDPTSAWGALALAAACAFIPLLQLLPLPADLVPQFPIRGVEHEVWAIVGAVPQVTSLSVSASATILSLLSMLPALALFLSVRVLTRLEKKIAVLALIIFGIISASLGLLQLSQGKSSVLRFYQITNPDDAVGFFANRNHYAALLNCVLIFSIAWMVQIAATPRRGGTYGKWRSVALVAAGTTIITLLAGAAMSRSRAGFGITIFALLAGALLAVGMRGGSASRITPLRMLGIVVGAGMFMTMQYALFRLLDRFATDPLQDARVVFAQTTYAAIKAYFPFGSGLGTFTRVHPLFETPERALIDTYANRAHNDFIEYALESGVFGASLIVLAALVLVRKLFAAWRSGERGAADLDVILQRSAGLVLILIAVHSVFDYPLRTSAMMAVMAVAAGLLMGPRFSLEKQLARASRDVQASSHRVEAADPKPEIAATDPRNLAAPASRSGMAWGKDITWPKEWQKPTKAPNGGSSSE